MILILSLVAAALVLLFFEVILPGGVLGILAAACVLLATWLGYEDYGLMGAVCVFGGSILAAIVMVYFQFKYAARSGLGRKFFLASSVTGHSNQSARDEGSPLVGREGRALTRMNPSGMVAIDGQSYQAFSQDGFIDVDTPVAIVGKDSFKLIIRKL